jgi:tetratricopeptide (TPR) repeat protein
MGLLDEADALLTNMPDRPTMITDFVWAKPVAELALARGKADRALLILDGIQLPDRSTWNGRTTLFFGPLLYLKGKILFTLNRLVEARRCLLEAIELYEKSEIKLGLWPMYLSLGRLHLQMNDHKRATEAFQAVREAITVISETLGDDALRTTFRQRIEEKLLQEHG